MREIFFITHIIMKIFLCLLVFIISSFSQAQEKTRPDTLQQASNGLQFIPQQLILPASLITVSALGIKGGPLEKLNTHTREWISGFNSSQIRIDDYLRFIPSAAHLGLGCLQEKAKHSFKERLLISATAHVAMAIMTQSTKMIVREQRPDASENNSFPSGHTALTFTGAELVRLEYGTGYGIAAYTIACGVAFLRLYNDSHWLNDVIAGAGIGILSARIGYWLLPLNRKIFRLNPKDKAHVIAAPYYTRGQGGIAMTITF